MEVIDMIMLPTQNIKLEDIQMITKSRMKMTNTVLGDSQETSTSPQ